MDEFELFRDELARGCGSGGAVHGRSVLRTSACRQEGSDGGAVGRQGRLGGFWRADENGAWPCGRAKARGTTRRLGCACVQNMRSGRAQSTHAMCSTKCQRVLEGLNEAGS